MKRALYILALLAVPLGAMAVVEEEEVGEIVAGKYAQFNKALIGKNMAAYTALCTADCKFQMKPGGISLSLDQFKRIQQQGFRTITIQRAKTTVDSVASVGDRAVIQATWTADVRAKSGKNMRNLRYVQKLRDTWTKSQSDWRLRASVVQSSISTPIKHASSRR